MIHDTPNGQTQHEQPKWPATRIVHCPNGPVNACDEHAKQITGLMSFLGAHIVHTAAADGAQCENCVNEHKGSNVELRGCAGLYQRSPS